MVESLAAEALAALVAADEDEVERAPVVAALGDGCAMEAGRAWLSLRGAGFVRATDVGRADDAEAADFGGAAGAVEVRLAEAGFTGVFPILEGRGLGVAGFEGEDAAALEGAGWAMI